MTSIITGQAISSRRDVDAGSLRWLPALVVAALSCYLAPRALVGADTMWMVALGERVATTGSVPDGVPFAAADTSGWPNVPALGELLMYAVHSLSPVGLAVALLGLTAATLLLLGRGGAPSRGPPGGSRRRGGPGGSGSVADVRRGPRTDALPASLRAPGLAAPRRDRAAHQAHLAGCASGRRLGQPAWRRPGRSRPDRLLPDAVSTARHAPHRCARGHRDAPLACG